MVFSFLSFFKQICIKIMRIGIMVEESTKNLIS